MLIRTASTSGKLSLSNGLPFSSVVVGEIVREDDHAARRDVGADHVQPVLRALVLLVGDVGHLVPRRQVEPPDVGEGELGLAQLLRQRRGGELLAHPLEEVAAGRHPP